MEITISRNFLKVNILVRVQIRKIAQKTYSVVVESESFNGLTLREKADYNKYANISGLRILAVLRGTHE